LEEEKKGEALSSIIMETNRSGKFYSPLAPPPSRGKGAGGIKDGDHVLVGRMGTDLPHWTYTQGHTLWDPLPTKGAPPSRKGHS